MEEPFFTSDTHFYHKRILEFCRKSRRGETVEEMNELMVKAWNEKVPQFANVYHLGDFSFGTKEKTIAMIQRLNGHIHLVQGNHDKMLNCPEMKLYFASYNLYKTIVVRGQRIVMMHYPIESWDRMQHGTIHLHGHLHGDDHHECRLLKNRLDVGIDTRPGADMAPWSFSEVMEYIKQQNKSLEKLHG